VSIAHPRFGLLQPVAAYIYVLQRYYMKYFLHRFNPLLLQRLEDRLADRTSRGRVLTRY
jgi:hypothetical protein